nr:hypothetical protein JVH1_0954 [Rhodococcus sp. JVH1]
MPRVQVPIDPRHTVAIPLVVPCRDDRGAWAAAQPARSLSPQQPVSQTHHRDDRYRRCRHGMSGCTRLCGAASSCTTGGTVKAGTGSADQGFGRAWRAVSVCATR